MATAGMLAAVITRPGAAEVLEIREVPRPRPGAGEILVRVRASALNRADLLQREGRYPPPPGAPADLPGIEFAGAVAALGRGTREWREGDRVFGIVAGGAHAEYLVTHERAVARVPDVLDWPDAAAIPEAFITAHDAMFTQGGIRPSERVLIHAVGSGVGLAAVQLARAAGAIPFGTSRTADKIDRARGHGLEDGLALGAGLEPLMDAVRSWTGGVGIELVLDLVGGPYTAASLHALAPLGRLILIGTLAGGTAELSLRHILGRRLTIRGTVLRSRPLEEKILATRAFAASVIPLLATGTVRATIDRTFPLGQIADAHRWLETNRTFGKVVLEICG